MRQIPRSLVQITLQIHSLPDADASSGVNSSLSLLPHLLHTAFLALLSASIPLSTTLTAALVAFPASRSKTSTPLVAPSADELRRAKPMRSVHVFAFAGDGRMLLNESEGAFGYEEWEEACEMAEEVCCKEEGGVRLGEGMEVDGRANLEVWLREVGRRKVEAEQRWKNAV